MIVSGMPARISGEAERHCGQGIGYVEPLLVVETQPHRVGCAQEGRNPPDSLAFPPKVHFKEEPSWPSMIRTTNNPIGAAMGL